MAGPKIYDVKASASENFIDLLSSDNQYFYWNDTKFRSNNIGDKVFVIDRNNGKALFTEIEKKDIKTVYDQDIDRTEFEDLGRKYSAQKKWDKFIRFKIIESEDCPERWNWTKQLGSSETCHLFTEDVSEVVKKLEKISDLKKIFSSGQANQVLIEAEVQLPQANSTTVPENSIEYIKSFLDLQNRIKIWSSAFLAGHPATLKVTSQTAHWYYSPIYDTFGPSKFIGYRDIPIDENQSNGLDGRDTEVAISKLKDYTILENGNNNFQKYQQKLKQFLLLNNKKPKSNAQIHISEKLEIRKLMFNLHRSKELFSYKYVMLKALFQNADDNSKSTHEYFWEYYQDRKANNLSPDKENSKISQIDLTTFNHSEINSILDAPFDAINNCSADESIIIKDESGYRFNAPIIDELNDHAQELRYFINFKLDKYYKDIDIDSCSFWWVNQGQTYLVEKEGGFIWSPQKGKKGKPIYHWENVYKVKKGDIIFHYDSGFLRAVSVAKTDGYENNRPENISGNSWDQAGYRVDTEYEEFNEQIPLKFIGQEIADLQLSYGPINSSGGVNQGYLYSLNEDAVKIIKSQMSIEQLSPSIKKQMEKVSSITKTNGEIMSDKQVIEHVYDRLSSQGFIISKADLINFYCCLRTKPFVILAGISGTGKTRFVRLFAEAVGATEDNDRFSVIPVRPDWNDNTELLGFFDLNEQYQPGALIPMLIRAHANPEKPYFICLDEMNLARVEHYFSDFLSIIESRQFKKINGQKRVVTDRVLTPQQMANMNTANIDDEISEWLPKLSKDFPKGLGVPENLYFVGTVNMDETTHPFSRKVLDRANTLEFNDIHLSKGLTLPANDQTIETLDLQHLSFKSKYLTMFDLLGSDGGTAKTVSEKLEELNYILSKAGCQVGYRVRDEAAFYMKYVSDVNSSDLDETAGFERVVLQKIMPRIQGSSFQIKQILENLLQQFVPESLQIETDDDDYIMNLQNLIENKGALPKKIGHMLIQFIEDGFTSFWSN